MPLYPVVFAAAFVILTWADGGIHPALLIRPLVIAAAVSLGVTLLLAAIFNDRHRAGFLVLVIVLALLAADMRLVFVLLAAGLLLLVEGVVRRGRPIPGIHIATRVMSGVALIVALAVVLKLLDVGAVSAAVSDVTNRAMAPLGQAKPGSPDIYVFLLDAYPGDRAAARSSTFDADAFPADLEARGFEVVRDTHSNYLLTPLTLVSMLSMRHIDDIPELGPPYGPTREDWRRVRTALSHAPALVTLRAAGYETIVLDAGYAHAELRAVDRFIEAPEPAELEQALRRNTRLDDLVEAIAPGTLADTFRARITGSFDRVRDLALEPHTRPRFVFVHVPGPHPPWVFEADGTPRNPALVSLTGESELSEEAGLEAGFAQATHVGHLAIGAIDDIQKASAVPPVVVVMSDHGPMGDFSTVTPLTSDIGLRASSFMAAVTPGHPDVLADRPTPVNLFGALFAAYLDRPAQPVPDSIWAWRNGSYIDTVEVPPITGWTD